MLCRNSFSTEIDNMPSEKSIFRDLSSTRIEEVNKNKTSNMYKKGTTTFLQGNPSYGIFEVLSGKVKVTRVNIDGEETILKIADMGAILGHRCLFDDATYSVSAQTLEDSRINFYDSNFIQKLSKEEPSIATNLMTYMSNEIYELETRIQSFARKNVRERLAELLIYLWDNFKSTGSDTRKVDLSLSRDEMASIIGVASETLIRLMSEFNNEGLIEKKGKFIYLLDQRRLKEYANIF